MLDDPVTAQYTHNLTVTGRHGGEYQCNVSNSKPSSDTAELIIVTGSNIPPSNPNDLCVFYLQIP